MLPGNLRTNIDECAAIAARLNQTNGDLSIPLNAVHGLLDPPTDTSQMTHDERLQAFISPDAPALYPHGDHQYSYDPSHMLCRICVIEILGQRFYGWWRAERKSPRVSSESIVLRIMLCLIVIVLSSRFGRLLVGVGVSNSASVDAFREIERE